MLSAKDTKGTMICKIFSWLYSEFREKRLENKGPGKHNAWLLGGQYIFVE